MVEFEVDAQMVLGSYLPTVRQEEPTSWGYDRRGLSLIGLPGVGKTKTADMLCRRYPHNYVSLQEGKGVRHPDDDWARGFANDIRNKWLLMETVGKRVGVFTLNTGFGWISRSMFSYYMLSRVRAVEILPDSYMVPGVMEGAVVTMGRYSYVWNENEGHLMRTDAGQLLTDVSGFPELDEDSRRRLRYQPAFELPIGIMRELDRYGRAIESSWQASGLSWMPMVLCLEYPAEVSRQGRLADGLTHRNRYMGLEENLRAILLWAIRYYAIPALRLDIENRPEPREIATMVHEMIKN